MKSSKKRSKKSPPPDVYVAMTYTFFAADRKASQEVIYDAAREAISDEMDNNGCATIYVKLDAGKLYSLDPIVVVDEDNIHMSIDKPALELVHPWYCGGLDDWPVVEDRNVFELLRQSVDYDADDSHVDVQAVATDLETCHRLMKKFGYKRVKAK